jgi:hypothetical protein
MFIEIGGRETKVSSDKLSFKTSKIEDIAI